MDWEDITYSGDFLNDIEIKASYLINIPEKGILTRIEVEKIEWRFFSSELTKRWNWYFRYRAALLQIKYPKYEVEIKFLTSDLKSKKQEINLLERKILAKRRKFTEFLNKAEKLKANHFEIFPIEDHPKYKAYKQIAEIKKSELDNLINELNKIK